MDTAAQPATLRPARAQRASGAEAQGGRPMVGLVLLMLVACNETAGPSATSRADADVAATIPAASNLSPPPPVGAPEPPVAAPLPSAQSAVADASAPGELVQAPLADGPGAVVGDAAMHARPPQTSTAELKLLTRARRMLRSSPARALALTVDHQRAFKQPRQAERREVIAIEALVRLSRGDEARARARAYFLAFPQASEGARVRILLAESR